MKHDTITLPEHWANYLVNGDASEMTGEETSAIRKYLDRELPRGYSVCDVKDDSARFTNSYSLYDSGLSGATSGTVADFGYLY